MKNSRPFVLMLLTCLVACSSGGSRAGAGKPKGFVIEGKFASTTKVNKISLAEIDLQGLRMVDSTQVADDGTFVMRGNAATNGFYLLRFEGGDVPLYLDSLTKVNLSIDAAKPEDYTLKGSPENDRMQTVINIGKRTYKALGDWQKQFQGQAPNDSLQKVFKDGYMSIMAGRDEELKSFINKNQACEAGLFTAIYLWPNSELSSFVRENYGFYDGFDTKYASRYGNSKYFKMLHSIVDGIRSTAIGNIMAEIKLPDTAGLMFSTTEYRGKVVLVDFWASWCMPCRAENPNVVNAYRKYHSQGFDVVGVSLDNDKSRWKAAIAKDGLTWKHISELKGWRSSVCQKFNVSSIPFSILLDREGRIVATNLRGELLEEKLRELFGN